MCEFCLKHGEGKKWYLQAKNYSEDLLSDIRRRRFIEGFLTGQDTLAREAERAGQLDRLPGFIKSMFRRLITRKMKKQHFGQVVPIEDVERVFGFVNSVTRTACICRHVTVGQEKRYCYGVSMGPDGGEFGRIFRGLDKSFAGGPFASGLERLTKEEALAALCEHEREGLCHTIWTFHTPFIAGVCNCDRADCLAMRYTVTHDIPLMFRAEYVARVDPDKCTGCRSCMRSCQFGAIGHSASLNKAVIDQRWCYGCGICRAACKTGAIRLEDRGKVPAAANLW